MREPAPERDNTVQSELKQFARRRELHSNQQRSDRDVALIKLEGYSWLGVDLR